MTIHSNVSFVISYDKLYLCLDILLQLMASGMVLVMFRVYILHTHSMLYLGGYDSIKTLHFR